MQALSEGGWKTLCPNGTRKFKRKSREPVKIVSRIKGCTRGEDAAGHNEVRGESGGETGRWFAAVDGPPASPSAVLINVRMCEKRDEKRFPPLPVGSYTHRQAALPRRRLGQTSSVVSEIKAIQQTRRLLANARERTRVHTISAAFEALRKQVPCYSYGQKLSKLAILRIACNYIVSLAQLMDLDYTPDHSNISFAECVEQCTRTLQAEGRSKKRKE